MNEKPKGLYGKYVVTKTSGSPVDPESEFLVLRLDSGKYVEACRAGARMFAVSVRRQNLTLSNDVLERLAELEEKKED